MSSSSRSSGRLVVLPDGEPRQAVADVLEGASAAGASEAEIDSFIRQLRVEQCDLISVLSTAAWLAAERARLAHQRDVTLPGPAWATPQEIADDRGAPLEHVQQLIDDAPQARPTRRAHPSASS